LVSGKTIETAFTACGNIFYYTIFPEKVEIMNFIDISINFADFKIASPAPYGTGSQ